MNHHATLSPSSFPAMEQCPCFQSAPGTSEAAEEGTRQHKQLESLLTVVNEEDTDFVPGVLWARDKIIANFKSCDTEVKLSLLKDFQEITHGTADVVGYLNDGMLAVYDYKSGQQRDSSAQLAVYALMAMQKHGKTECVCIIGYGRDQWEDWSILTLEEAEAIVYGIIDKVQNIPQPAICEYCQWCANSGNCSAESTAITTVATGYDDTIDLTDIETWHSSEITDPAQMAKVYRVACVLYKWADSVKHHAKEAIQGGMTIPGYKLRSGAKKRHIADIEAAYKASGMTPEEFLSCCSVSVADLEKNLTASRGVKGKKAVSTMMDEVFGEVIYIKENAPSIVAEKEKK